MKLFDLFDEFPEQLELKLEQHYQCVEDQQDQRTNQEIFESLQKEQHLYMN